MRRVEAAISARLERVVQEVIEVRQRAQTLSDELELVRAERGALLATLEEERAALAAARAALESERANWKEHRVPITVEPVPLPEEEPLPVVELEPEPLVVAETLAPRLPSPRKLLGKLKLVGRNKGKGEEPAPPPVSVTPKEEALFTEPQEPAVIEAPATEVKEAIETVEPAATIEFAPVALLLDDELEPGPAAPVAPVVAEKPKRATTPRTAKPRKVAIAAPPRFAPREFLASLPGLDDDQLDLAAFGIAQLDDSAGIIALNHRGGVLLGTSKTEALDRILFGDLLPHEDATTRFSEGVALGKLDAVVSVGEGLAAHLFRHAKSRTNWVLLRKQEGQGA